MFSKVEIVLDDTVEDPKQIALMKASIRRRLTEYDPSLIEVSWKRRRADMISSLNVIELNMRYDMEMYCKGM